MAAAAPIGGIVGGIGSLMGSHSASKAAKAAAAQADKYLKEAVEASEKGIEGYKGSADRANAQFAAGYADVMRRLGFGDDIINQALQNIGKSTDAFQVAQSIIGTIDDTYQQGRQDLLEGKDMALDFSNNMKDISQQYLGFTQGIWDNWESMFGDMRGNLIDHYSNMDPDKYATMWKADIRKEMDRALTNFDESAARSGIYTSGNKLQAMKDMGFKQAEAFQQANLAADDYVRQQQAGFYGQFGEPARQEAQKLQGSGVLNQAALLGTGAAPLMDFQKSLAGYQQGWGTNQIGQANTMSGIGQGYKGLAGTLGGLAYPVYGTASTVYQPHANMGQANMAYDANLANLYGNLANTYMKGSGAYGESAAGYGSAAGDMFGTGAKLLGNGLGSLFGGEE